MKKSIQSIATGLLAGMAFIALYGTAWADLSVSNSTATGSWNQVGGQSPFYVSLPSAGLTGFSAQGQPSAGSGATYTILSETFTITNGAGTLANGGTNYLLTGIAIIAGGQPANSSIHLYDVTTNLTSNNGTPLNGSGATYNFAVNGDLLGTGNGLSLSNVLSGTDQVLYNLSSGPNSQDQVVLGKGHTYAFEIKTPTTGGGFSWDRTSGVDAGGEGMGSHDASLAVGRVTLSSLGLAGGAPRTFALALYGTATSAALSVNNSTNAVPQANYVVDAFNSYGYGPTNYYVGTNDYNLGQITNLWGNWFGSAYSNLVWDATSDANNNASSGSLKILANFNSGGQYLVYDGFNGITPPLNALTNGLTRFQCDVRFDPSSATTINSGTGTTNYGHLQFGTRNGNNQDFFGSLEVPVGTTNWVHVNIPVSISSDANLIAINDVIVKIDGGWYGSNPLNGPSILWVDNLKFVGPASVVLPPPPALAMTPANPALRVFAGSSANTYDREELATVDSSQSWIGGAYPVSYSFKLLSYPANINQTHIFLVPANTSGQANMGNAGSVNEFIEYQASNALWMVINPAAAGVTASVQWKTNNPNNNPNITALTITNAKAVGTWTLTFNSASTGTLTAPGASPAAFTIGDASVSTDFANPLVAYFGVQPNSSTGIGQYEDWASIAVTNVAGANEYENFTTETSSSFSAQWANNSAQTASLVVVPNNVTPAYWVNWTLPAVGYGLGTSDNLLGSTVAPAPWVLPEYYNNYADGKNLPTMSSQGARTWVLVPSTCLPTVDGQPQDGQALSPNAYFKLVDPALTQ